MYNNLLEDIPSWFRGLKGLIELDVSSNKIVAVEEWIGDMKRLKRLNISHNEIQALPSSLFTCRSIENLDASGNRLLTLPETLPNHCRISNMDFRYNQLGYLPAWCFHSKLVSLGVQGNEWICQEECPSPNQFVKTLEQQVLAQLITDAGSHSELFTRLPGLLQQRMSENVHECERCRNYYCGTAAGTIEHILGPNGEEVPIVLRVCGADCDIKMRTESIEWKLMKEARRWQQEGNELLDR